MAAATAMQCKQLLDGSIQWLLYLAMCPASYCRIRMAIKIASNVPAFVVAVNFVVTHNCSYRLFMVHITVPSRHYVDREDSHIYGWACTLSLTLKTTVPSSCVTMREKGDSEVNVEIEKKLTMMKNCECLV